jgi:hypothetical protein
LDCWTFHATLQSLTESRLSGASATCPSRRLKHGPPKTGRCRSHKSDSRDGAESNTQGARPPTALNARFSSWSPPAHQKYIICLLPTQRHWSRWFRRWPRRSRRRRLRFGLGRLSDFLLLAGVELDVLKIEASLVVERLLRVGIPTKHTRRNTTRMAPPLVIERTEINWAVSRIEEVFEEIRQDVTEPLLAG